MRLCVAIPCFFENVDFCEAIAASRALGYDAVETYRWKGLDFSRVGEALEEHVRDILRRDGIDPTALVFSGECPVYDKYDEFLPPELLRAAFAEDRLCPREVYLRFLGEESPIFREEDRACMI